jgi:hypothetical protein
LAEFGGRLWGSLPILGSVVMLMLTLLLAPDAYIAIGLAFALLLLAALITLIAGRRHVGLDSANAAAAL